MPDIFLSYNREDQDAARWFAEGFEAAGFDVWWDVALRSGEAYDEVTETALRTARAVVVLWSARSVASRWVRSEATLADRNRTLVPVMIGACERPIMFELTQTADLIGWRGELADERWRALLADVRRSMERSAGAPESPATQPAEPAPPRRGGAPTLAVLPFTNRSGLAEDDVFAFGMVEDVIDALSRGVDVRVVSSSATARFRAGPAPDLDAMARHMGVRYVLEGNVRRVGQDLRVTTQLVDAAGGDIMWTRRFDRPLAQLADLQEDLVLEVAAHLRAQSHHLEIARALRKPGDVTAWEAVMRSIAAYRRMTGPALLLAITEARRAVEIAPDYALALATLAQAEGVLYNQLIPDNPGEAQRIRARAQEALRLEPDNPVVASTAAGALTTCGFPDEALAAAKRAVALNGENEFGHFACAVACTLLDRCDEALTCFAREDQLAPGRPMSWISNIWKACAQIRAGRWGDALATYVQTLVIAPDNAAPNIGHAVCLNHLGRREAARSAMALAREVEPETPLGLWEMRFARAYAGSAAREQFLGHLRSLWDDVAAEALEPTRSTLQSGPSGASVGPPS